MPEPTNSEILAELHQQRALLDRLMASLPLLAATAGDVELKAEQAAKAHVRRASAAKIAQGRGARGN